MGDFPDHVETERVLLRRISEGDLDTVARHLGDPDIARWMAAAKQPFGRREAEEIMALSHDPSRLIRVMEKDGAMVGCLCLSPDVWFWLDPASSGAGLMSYALREAIMVYFAKPAPPLLARCRDDNTRSLALLSRLGFSRIPAAKRMFFQAEGRAHTCHDHVMTPEQWLQLHPPELRHGSITLRPAAQKDAPTLMSMLPRSGRGDDGVWPPAEAMSVFIERHRCRTPGCGLFVLENELRCIVGMALLGVASGSETVRFMTPEDADRHASCAESLLARTGKRGSTILLEQTSPSLPDTKGAS